MPAIQKQPVITTLEEYEALPEDIRAEIFDGDIYYMASPSQIHQTILTEQELISKILTTLLENDIIFSRIVFFTI